MDLVSIIVPIWGTKYLEYLPEAQNRALEQTYPYIEVIIVNDCTDLPTARNRGIKMARGKYILCLDADDLISPDYVEKCINLMNEYDVVGGGIKEFGDNDRFTYIEQTNDFTTYNKMHSTALYRKEMWEKLGGYDEQMKLGLEDWDFWYRASKQGYKFKMINEPIFFYRKHGKSMINSAMVRQQEIVDYMLNKYKYV